MRENMKPKQEMSKKASQKIDIPSVILESYGFDVHHEDKQIAESYAKDDNEKIFGIDKTFSNNLSNTVNFIMESENFDSFIDQLYECVKKTDNISLYSKWMSESLIKETLQKALETELTKMYIGEVFQYGNLVDELFKKHNINESYQAITHNGYDFSTLPRIVRIH